MILGVRDPPSRIDCPASHGGMSGRAGEMDDVPGIFPGTVQGIIRRQFQSWRCAVRSSGRLLRGVDFFYETTVGWRNARPNYGIAGSNENIFDACPG